jgi:hypothetical protein
MDYNILYYTNKMTAKIIKYSLDDFNNIIFNGFNYELPSETLKIISELALEVGSPTYVKTPIFQKKENPIKSDTSGNFTTSNGFKKKKGHKNMEINDSDWESLRSFQATKIEERVGINSEIDNIRFHLNKLSDKNYIDIRNKIMEIIDNVINNNSTSEDITRVSSAIFEIASTNRFYSKMYADLYSDIITKYEIMKDVFKQSLSQFSELFNVIEYVDPSVDYDKFCKINKDNEKRKAIGVFFINLSMNGIIPNLTIVNITRNLLSQIYSFISQENKKNEVDELTENVALFYKKEFYIEDDEDDVEYELIEGYTITEIIQKIAHSKVKDYKSLTNKSIFKFMDMIDM